MNRPKIDSRQWIDLLVIGCGFAALVVIVDPRGDFPLDDDWNFALSSWHFAETGTFRFARMTGMSLRLQVLWGALWTELFGRSFEVLRFSTLFLSLATLLVFNRLLVRVGVSRVGRMAATFALLVHPMFFWSSFTFMTHVPFLFLSVVAFYFHLRGITEQNWLYLILGAAAVIGSYFIRQTGISNALAPLILLLLGRERVTTRWKSFAVAIAAPLALFVIVWFGSDLLKGYPGQLQVHYEAFEENPAAALAEVVLRIGVSNFQYGFLFLLPVVPALGPTPRSRPVIVWYLLLLNAFIWRAAYMVSIYDPIPYATGGEVFINFGLGPATLRDTWVLPYRYPFRFVERFWAPVTFLAAAGGAWLLLQLGRSVRPAGNSAPNLARSLAAIHGLVATALLFTSAIYFDRYSLDSLWGVIVLAGVASSWPTVVARRVSILLILVGFFSVFATQEYIRWNRARWRAFDYLRSRGVTLAQMDGGYEINQYLLGRFDGPVDLGVRGFSVVDDEYILTFRPVPGYVVLARFPFSGFLGLRRGYVYALQRVASPVKRVQRQ